MQRGDRPQVVAGGATLGHVHLPELPGRRITLRRVTEGDRARIIEIRGTDEVWARWRGHDLDAKFSEGLQDAASHQFAIEASGKVVGMVQFAEEGDPDYRHATIDIFVDPAVHRQGIAGDALTTLAQWLFDHRGHHRLTIDPAADNEAAIACYAKVGFRTVGVLRAYERQPDGTWADGLLMDLLRDDLRRE